MGALFAASAGVAQAEVLASSPAGFVVRFETAVSRPPAEVYQRFLQIGQWWSDAHTYSGKALNMTLRNEPGGCFCETLPGGGFVRHASVEYSDPGKLVRLSGGLGPLQELGAHGVLSFNFMAPTQTANIGTRLVVSYVVSGFQPDPGFAALAAPVEGVLKEQVERLKRLTETGNPGTP